MLYVIGRWEAAAPAGDGRPESRMGCSMMARISPHMARISIALESSPIVVFPSLACPGERAVARIVTSDGWGRLLEESSRTTAATPHCSPALFASPLWANRRAIAVI